MGVAMVTPFPPRAVTFCCLSTFTLIPNVTAPLVLFFHLARDRVPLAKATNFLILQTFLILSGLPFPPTSVTAVILHYMTSPEETRRNVYSSQGERVFSQTREKIPSKSILVIH